MCFAHEMRFQNSVAALSGTCRAEYKVAISHDF